MSPRLVHNLLLCIVFNANWNCCFCLKTFIYFFFFSILFTRLGWACCLKQGGLWIPHFYVIKWAIFHKLWRAQVHLKPSIIMRWTGGGGVSKSTQGAWTWILSWNFETCIDLTSNFLTATPVRKWWGTDKWWLMRSVNNNICGLFCVSSFQPWWKQLLKIVYIRGETKVLLIDFPSCCLE